MDRTSIDATGAASIRRRRLPAEQVVWLVITLAIYRHWSISEVVDSLDLTLPNEATFVSKSAVAQARQRLGDAPMAWLFSNTAFGRYDANEMLYAKQLLEQIPNDSLTVFDEGFPSAEILCGLNSSERNRHFLISAKSNTRWEMLSAKPDDALVRMRVSPQARQKCPELPE